MIKILLIVFSLIILLILVIYSYGLLLPEKRSISKDITINASPEIIYDLAIDAKTQNLWRRDVLKITMGSDSKKWVEHTKQGDISFEITKENRPHGFNLKFKAQSFHGKWQGKFVPVNLGSKVSLVETASINSPFLRVLSKVMKFSERFMDSYIYDLKTEAEKRQNIS